MLEEVFSSDYRWISLLSNQLYFKEFINWLLKDSTDCVYGGSFLRWGEDEKHISLIKDKESHHIVGVCRPATRGSKQKFYPTFSDFMKAHPVVNPKKNIYFVGSVSEVEDEEVYVHWNCFVVHQNTLIWFNPSGGKSAFEHKHRNEIKDYFKNLTMIQIEPWERPQQYIQAGTDYVDNFCHSWCLMFAAAFIENKLSYFCQLNFKYFQNVILKTWLIHLFKEMPEWYEEYQRTFPHLGYARINLECIGKKQCEIVEVAQLNNNSNSALSQVIEYFIM